MTNDCDCYHAPFDSIDLLTGEHRTREVIVPCRACEHEALGDEADTDAMLAEAPQWELSEDDVDAMARYFGYEPDPTAAEVAA